MDHARALLAQPELPELTDEVLQQMLFDNYRGAIEFLCDAEEEAHLMIRNHVKFARAAIAADRARRPTPQPLPEGLTDGELDGMERRYWKLGSSIEIDPEGISEVWDRKETFDHRAFARAAISAACARALPTPEAQP